MSSEKPRWWQKNKQWILVASIVIFGIGFAVITFLGYWFNWDWTGLNASVGPNVRQYQPTKTLWDWLQLLIIPIFLAGTAFLFNVAMKRSEAAIEQKRYESEHELAEKNQKEELLQGYLDRMSELLLDKGLRSSGRDTEIRDIARARTLTVLSRLDSDRKGSLIKFIYEAGLINTDGTGSVIDLSEADLSSVNLERAKLTGANLSRANLTNANLNEARLGTVDLTGVDLTGAKLTGAKLSEANLTGANLSNANLAGATLVGAKLYQAKLIEANLHSVNLNGANLTEADLRNTDLSMAILRSVNLREANLTGANLDQADKEDVVFSDEQNEQMKEIHSHLV